MFDVNPSIFVDAPMILVIDPLFAADFHLIAYEPELRRHNLNDTDVVVADVLVGEVNFPRAV